MTKDEALRLAFAALEGADEIDCDMRDAITAIKAALAQPAQPEALRSTNNFCMTDEHVEILATMLHCVPCEEDELRIDLNAFCHDARTSIIKAAQPDERDRCTHGVWAADHCYKCALAQEQGLFVDLIAKHKGLAEELAKMDLEPQPEQEPVANEQDAFEMGYEPAHAADEDMSDWSD